MNEITNNKVNLCDSCSQVYPDCTSKPEDVYFGDGAGHDNICACSEYRPSVQPECTQECMPKYANVSDCISRQAAIDEAYEIIIDGQKFEVVQVETLMGLPPAQPEHLSDDDFETIRIHLSAFMWELWNQGRVKEAKDYQALIDRFMAFATEPHDIIRCKDCENFQTDWKPQDSDGHYCAVMDRVMEDDGFCSHAERKDDE